MTPPTKPTPLEEAVARTDKRIAYGVSPYTDDVRTILTAAQSLTAKEREVEQLRAQMDGYKAVIDRAFVTMDAGKPSNENFNLEVERIVKERDTLLAQAEQLKQAAGFCDKHQPTGGARNCLVCAVEKLSHTLSHISYLCGKPNEMQQSEYDVHYNEEEVVKQVQDGVEDKRRVASLEKTFQHMHVNNQTDDTCARCGLDLRDGVHQRAAITTESKGDL